MTVRRAARLAVLFGLTIVAGYEAGGLLYLAWAAFNH